MHPQWAFGKLHNCCTKVGTYVLNALACKSVLCDQIATVPACWLNCVQTDNIFFLALVTRDYWSVITCHEIWQNWQGCLGFYAHHLWEIITYWQHSKIVELERMILRSLHTIEAQGQEICDIMGDGDWNDICHHSLWFCCELV